MRYLFVLLLCNAGCILPVSSAVPDTATTLGKSELGFHFHAELPTVDVLVEDNDPDLTPLPSGMFELAYGATEDIDVFVGGEGVFLLVPIPLGGYLGGKVQLPRMGHLWTAVSGKVGYVSGSSEVTTQSSTTDIDARAMYGEAAVHTGLASSRWVRPTLGLGFKHYAVTEEDDGMSAEYGANSIAATLSIQFTAKSWALSPFVGATYFTGTRFSQGVGFVHAGISLLFRPDKVRKAQFMPEMP